MRLVESVINFKTDSKKCFDSLEYFKYKMFNNKPKFFGLYHVGNFDYMNDKCFVF